LQSNGAILHSLINEDGQQQLTFRSAGYHQNIYDLEAECSVKQKMPLCVLEFATNRGDVSAVRRIAWLFPASHIAPRTPQTQEDLVGRRTAEISGEVDEDRNRLVT